MKLATSLLIPSKEPYSPQKPANSHQRKILIATVLFLLVLAVTLLNQQNTSNLPDPQHNTKQIAIVQSPNDKLIQQARQLLSVWKAHENSEAIEILESVLINAPQHVDARLTLSFALSSRETKFGGEPKDAVRAEELARELLTENKTDALAWHALG